MKLVELIVKLIPDTSEMDKAFKKYSTAQTGTAGAGKALAAGGMTKAGAAFGLGAGIGLAVAHAVNDVVGEALKNVQSLLGGILRMLGALLGGFLNLLIPLLVPVLMFITPIVRLLNQMLRPVLYAMMQGMKSGLATGGAAGAFAGALGAGFVKLGELFLIIFARVIEEIAKYFWDVVITGFQFLGLIIGGVALVLAKLLSAFLGLFGIDASGVEDAIGGFVVNAISAMEIYKQLGMVLQGIVMGGVVNSFANDMLGIESAAEQTSTSLTLTQTLLVAVAGIFGGGLQNALRGSFETINQTTSVFMALIKAAPDVNAQFGIFQSVLSGLIDGIIAGKTPVEAYAKSVSNTAQTALDGSLQIGELQISIDKLSSAHAVSELAKLQAMMDRLESKGGYSYKSMSSYGAEQSKDSTWGGVAGMLFGGGLGALAGFAAGGPVGAVAGALIGGGAGAALGAKYLAEGGHIEKEGIAYLHAGEDVVPAAEVRDRGTGGTIQLNMPITINGGGGFLSQDQINRVLKEVEVRLQSRKVVSGGFI